MPRFRALALLVIASAVLGAFVPARAQEPTTTEPPQPTTTVTLPATSVPTSLPPLPPPPPTTAPVNDPDAGGDAPPEPVPQDDSVIPPSTEDAAPGSLPPARGHVVTVDVRKAREASEAADAALVKATAIRSGLETEIHKLDATLARFDKAGKQAIIDLAAAKRQLTSRAVDAYIRGTDAATGIDRGGVTDEQLVESALLGAVVGRDDAAVGTYERLKKAATAAQAKVAAALAKGQQVLAAAVLVEQQATRQAQQSKFALAVTAAGGNIVIYGFVFPVAPPYTFSDSFGAPRYTGTDLEHWHQGVDIAAAEGQELLACERGIITQISPSQLGGNGIWIRGESGVSYYYAHLSRYADVQEGQVVEAGAVIGYVGTTGMSTGPHLHFEVHPNGGDAINPYPLLVAADPTFGPDAPATGPAS